MVSGRSPGPFVVHYSALSKMAMENTTCYGTTRVEVHDNWLWCFHLESLRDLALEVVCELLASFKIGFSISGPVNFVDWNHGICSYQNRSHQV